MWFSWPKWQNLIWLLTWQHHPESEEDEDEFEHDDDIDDESLNDDKFLRVKLSIVKDKIMKFEKFAEEC